MKLSVRNIVLFAVNLLLILGFVLCCVLYHLLAGKLLAQTAAQRWRGGSEVPYTQVSVFRPKSDALRYQDIYSIRKGIDEALVAVSLDPEANDMLTADAFCAIGDIAVSSAKTKSAQTTLYAIGGDFFVFHPLHLESGSYISERDLNNDLVVIDRELSWTLFGSVDSVGLTLTVDGRDYIVAGVVSRDDDFFTEQVDQTVSAIYMPFAAVYDYEEAVITSYETAMPNPVENFALDTVKNLASNGEFVENSERFTLGNVSELIFSFGKRAISASGIACPPWENAARLCEDYLALTVVFAAIFLAMPVVCAVILAIRAYKALRATGRRVASRIREKY